MNDSKPKSVIIFQGWNPVHTYLAVDINGAREMASIHEKNLFSDL